MKDEPEYAVDKVQMTHRTASGTVFSCWFFLAFFTQGLGQAFKTAAYYLLPLSCIWFSDSMVSYTGVMWGRGRYVDSPSDPVFLRLGGWFLLLIVPLFLMLIFAMNR
jgi:CDP-diglyceride synthetase